MDAENAPDVKRDDDEMSVASTASNFSSMSFHPTPHAARRQNERDIETGDIKKAKMQGCISLAISFTGDENKEAAEIDAHDWGGKLTAVFEGLQMGDAKIRGAPGHHRIEVEIRGSEKMTRKVKQWLYINSYFEDSRRVLYVLRRGMKEELVVVEGPLASGGVGVITVFRRDSSGLEKRTENAAIILYNGVFWDLLIHNADEKALEAAFREQVFREAGIPCWVAGPGGHHFQLANWPPRNPFLHAASMMGCTAIVQQLVEQYGCDREVNHARTKDKGTALHVAAYFGHSAMVELLLKLGADKTLKNKYKETALDAARHAKKDYEKGKFEMPKKPNYADESEMIAFGAGACDTGVRVDFRTTHPDWPGWDQIIQLLDDDAAARTQPRSGAR